MTRAASPNGSNGGSTSAVLPSLVGAEELAASLGIGVRMVRYLVSERRIPFVRVGRHVRFDPIEIRAWVDEGRVGPRGRR